jgi:choline kinase
VKTIILAAGRPDYRNMPTSHTGAQLMAVVKGRPIIAWVVGDFLKHAEGAATLVIRQNNEALKSFVEQLYGHNPRIGVSVQPEGGDNILYSALAGLAEIDAHHSMPVRIVLGDTLIRRAPYGSGDVIYTAVTHDLSEKWCLAEVDGEGRIVGFADKVKGLNTADYQTVVGRYEFSDGFALKTAILEALADNQRELSAALTRYAMQRPFTVVPVDANDWIDFGHLEGIAKAHNGLTEARVFNSIVTTTPVPMLTKRSNNAVKLEQEAHWYKNLPVDLQALTPRVFDFRQVAGGAELVMEYYGYPTLTEKFVYASLAPGFWQAMLETMFGLAKRFSEEACDLDGKVMEAMYATKTFSRLEELKAQNPYWHRVLALPEVTVNGRKLAGVKELEGYIRQKTAELAGNAKGSLIHGDLCFNNILFEPVSGVVKLIDPRGDFGQGMSVYGDIRYDIAKLRHSFCGRYDYITEGLFNLTHDIGGTEVALDFAAHPVEDAEGMFDELAAQFGFDCEEIRFIEALLFLSMLPLHSDSLQKQKAFFYQGLVKLNACYEAEFARQEMAA